MLNFYWYPRCSTCIRAKKALMEAGLELKLIDITLKPPSAKKIQSWLKNGPLELKQLLNTSGVEYRKPGIKKKIQDELAADPESNTVTRMLTNNGRLLKRPIICDTQRVTVGFKDPAKILAYWTGA